MPYPGVPKDKIPKMEDCVNSLMSQQSMRDKYPDEKDRKSHCIAICHNSIMGNSKKGGENENMEKAKWTTAYVNDLPDSSFAYVESGDKDESGKTTPRTKRHLPYKDAAGKIDPAHVRNALARLEKTEIPADAKASAKAKLVAAAKEVGVEVSEKAEGGFEFKAEDQKILDEFEKVVDDESDEPAKEEKAEDKPAEEKPAEEQPKEEAKPTEEAKPAEEKPAEEQPKEEAKPAEEPAKPTEEKPTEEVKPEEVLKSEDEAVAALEAVVKSEKLEDLKGAVEKAIEVLKARKPKTEMPKDQSHSCKADEAMQRIETVETSLKRIDAVEASLKDIAEKVDKLSSSIKAPAEGAAKGETPKEEAKKTEKVDDAPKEEVKKVDTSSEGASEILSALKDIKDRLTKVEQSPAPSKVVMYPHDFVQKADDKEMTLEKVEARLAELKKIQDSDPQKYMNEGFIDEAYELVKVRKQLKAKAQ